MKEIEKQILIVKEDLLKRFPNCSHTIIIHLWDDNTSSVECRYGTTKKLHISKYYNSELTYEEVDIKFIHGVIIGEDGITYYPRNNFN